MDWAIPFHPRILLLKNIFPCISNHVGVLGYAVLSRPSFARNPDLEPIIISLSLGAWKQNGPRDYKQQIEKPPYRRLLNIVYAQVYRLENCFRRRALRRPTFFRSTSRASRVTSPALLNMGLSVASKSINARVMP